MNTIEPIDKIIFESKIKFIVFKDTESFGKGFVL